MSNITDDIQLSHLVNSLHESINILACIQDTNNGFGWMGRSLSELEEEEVELLRIALLKIDGKIESAKNFLFSYYEEEDSQVEKIPAPLV